MKSSVCGLCQPACPQADDVPTMMRSDPMHWLLVLGLSLAFSACAGPNAAPPATGAVTSPGSPRHLCHAEPARFLVGQPFGADTLSQALTASGADLARVLRVDAVTTKEFRAGRLNVVVDGANRVVGVHCG